MEDWQAVLLPLASHCARAPPPQTSSACSLPGGHSCAALCTVCKMALGLHGVRTWTLNSSDAMCRPPHREVATKDSTIAQGMFREALRVSSAN